MAQSIGIIGGTFNPVHYAHLLVAERFVEEMQLARAYFVPAAVSPFKAGQRGADVGAGHRLAMLHRAVEGNPYFAVDDCELQRGGISYTIDTVRSFRRRFPPERLCLLIGGDQAQQFRQWRDWRDILEQAQLCVALRPGAADAATRDSMEAEPAFANRKVHWLRAPLLDLSSTTIRERTAMGKSTRYMLPESVRSYIAEHGLYRR